MISSFFPLASLKADGHTAGGQAVDSKMNRMMDVVPLHIHDRSGIFMGSYDEVQRVIGFHEGT